MREMLFLACFVAIVLVIVIDLLAWLILLYKKASPVLPLSSWPAVAVLVPARNEEKNLPACLQSLLSLHYPEDKLIILVGNDASTDQTLVIAEQWSKKYPHIRVINITNTVGMARGKANVLAQLAQQCPADVQYIFMTDADIRPNPAWIKQMLGALRSGVGLVNGTTTVCGASPWARWQQTDWAVALGLSKAYTYLPVVGGTLSAIGNNMLICREAYKSTGGYENIPFSITEDYELLQQLKAKGYEAVQLLDESSSACTEPVQDLLTLLHQRKRWMTGAMRLPLPMVALLFIQAFFFPAILVVLYIDPLTGGLMLLLKLLAQFMLARIVLQRLGVKERPAAGFFYELYSFCLSLMLIVFYFLPLKIKWKNRQYQSNRA